MKIKIKYKKISIIFRREVEYTTVLTSYHT